MPSVHHNPMLRFQLVEAFREAARPVAGLLSRAELAFSPTACSLFIGDTCLSATWSSCGLVANIYVNDVAHAAVEMRNDGYAWNQGEPSPFEAVSANLQLLAESLASDEATTRMLALAQRLNRSLAY